MHRANPIPFWLDLAVWVDPQFCATRAAPPRAPPRKHMVRLCDRYI